MLFFYPDLAQEINWAISYEILDKELQAITTKSLLGKRLVDKLFKVQSISGEERWVLMHIEIQGKSEAAFEQRLFEYYYRLYDRYRKPILTLVVLTDNKPTWRPEIYSAVVWNRKILSYRFFAVKLLDYKTKQAFLKKHENPFATVIAAHFVAKQTRNNIQQRALQKLHLTRRLFERGLGRENIHNLYKFIDWVITLPQELEIQYNEQIHQLEKEYGKVAYITTAERIGMQKGFEQGILKGIAQGRQEGRQEGEYVLLLRQLKHKFQVVPEHCLQRMTKADAELLLQWGEKVLEAKTIEEIFGS
jgi:hypothetical protein